MDEILPKRNFVYPLRAAHGAHLSELNNGVILPILLTLLFDIRTNVGCLGHHYILTICFCYIMYLQRS